MLEETIPNMRPKKVVRQSQKGSPLTQHKESDMDSAIQKAFIGKLGYNVACMIIVTKGKMDIIIVHTLFVTQCIISIITSYSLYTSLFLVNCVTIL